MTTAGRYAAKDVKNLMVNNNIYKVRTAKRCILIPIKGSHVTTIYLYFNGCSSGEHGLSGPISDFFLDLFGKENLWNKGTDCLWAKYPYCHPSNSVNA